MGANKSALTLLKERGLAPSGPAPAAQKTSEATAQAKQFAGALPAVGAARLARWGGGGGICARGAHCGRQAALVAPQTMERKSLPMPRSPLPVRAAAPGGDAVQTARAAMAAKKAELLKRATSTSVRALIAAGAAAGDSRRAAPSRGRGGG